MDLKFQGKLPVVTILAACFNIGIWILMELAGDTQDSIYMLAHGAAYTPYITEKGEWWRLFSSMFLHFGAEHLLNNMLMLVLMGMRLEHTLGSVRFAVLYLAGGLCGNLLSLAQEMHTLDYAVSAGASGAVFGIAGALLAWALLHKGHVEGLTARGLAGMAALSLYYGFAAEGVDNWGHIGGLLGGFVLGIVFSILSKTVDFKRGKQYTIKESD